MSRERAERLTSIPLSFNCLWRLFARSSGLAVRNTFSVASGKTWCPYRGRPRPARGLAEAVLQAQQGRPDRRDWCHGRGQPANFLGPQLGADIHPLSQICSFPRSSAAKRMSRLSASVTNSDSASSAIPRRSAARPNSRYRAPLSSRCQPSAFATFRAIVPLPDPLGPSSARTGIGPGAHADPGRALTDNPTTRRSQ